MRIANWIAFIALLVGGLNWLLVGIFGFDLVAFVFGSPAVFLARLIYIIVGLSAVWLIISASIQKRITLSDYD